MINAPSRRRRARSAVVPKATRDLVVNITVEADDCAQALLRVLGLIVQHGKVPLAIAVDRDEFGQRFDVDIDTLPEHAASILLEKIAAIVSVKRARLARRPRLSD